MFWLLMIILIVIMIILIAALLIKEFFIPILIIVIVSAILGYFLYRIYLNSPQEKRRESIKRIKKSGFKSTFRESINDNTIAVDKTRKEWLVIYDSGLLSPFYSLDSIKDCYVESNALYVKGIHLNDDYTEIIHINDDVAIAEKIVFELKPI